jgi:hypothetical protein
VQLPSTTIQPPAVGQGVWVSFLGGDPAFPIWVGKFGTEVTDNYPWYVSKVSPDEVTPEITDLFSLRQISNDKSEADLTQTLLNIVRNRYHGSFLYKGTQTAVLANTAYAMPLDTTETSYGVSVVGGNTIRIDHNGTYNIAFSAQLSSSNNAEHTVNIWLRHQGVDVPYSNSRLQFKGHAIAAWNFFVENNTEPQDWQLMWSTSSTNVVSIASLAAGAPFPATAAIILTVNKVK